MSEKHLFEVSYVDRLLRERDEARAKLDAWDGLKQQEAKAAEARGYRRGIKNAAELVANRMLDDEGCADAILALLEKSDG